MKATPQQITISARDHSNLTLRSLRICTRLPFVSFGCARLDLFVS